MGDVRDSHADVSRARRWLGWTPKTAIEDGIALLKAWADGRSAASPFSSPIPE